MNIVQKKRFASGVLAAALVVSGLLPVLTAKGGANAAVAYLQTKPVNPWSAMALASVGESPDVSGLKNVSSEKAIDYTAPILALTANNKDPRTYPETNYIQKLKSFYDGTQLGEAGIINDDIFGLLALLSSGVPANDGVTSGIKTHIKNNQNADGGWSFAAGGASDTNMTAMGGMALLESGVPKTDPDILEAVR